MPADPRDDFSAFAGSEHMFFGLSDPFAMIRRHLEDGLRKQVSDTAIEAIAMESEPKFLTIGRKTDDEKKVVVAHFGFCIRARVNLTYDQGRKRERMPAALTFLFGHVDRADDTKMRTHFDLHADAARGFDDETFKQRFLAFRAELP